MWKGAICWFWPEIHTTLNLYVEFSQTVLIFREKKLDQMMCQHMDTSIMTNAYIIKKNLYYACLIKEIIYTNTAYVLA
jgi:hypothetical protein